MSKKQGGASPGANSDNSGTKSEQPKEALVYGPVEPPKVVVKIESTHFTCFGFCEFLAPVFLKNVESFEPCTRGSIDFFFLLTRLEIEEVPPKQLVPDKPTPEAYVMLFWNSG
jgi:hypothetical protein